MSFVTGIQILFINKFRQFNNLSSLLSSYINPFIIKNLALNIFLIIFLINLNTYLFLYRLQRFQVHILIFLNFLLEKNKLRNLLEKFQLKLNIFLKKSTFILRLIFLIFFKKIIKTSKTFNIINFQFF
jgi:hypothetical protein